MAAEPGRLLSHLRQEAISLVETELPSVEELRPVVGALVKALERVAGDEVDRFIAPELPVSDATGTVPVTSAPPVPSAAATPAAAPSVVTGAPAEAFTTPAAEQSAEHVELEELRRRVAELEGRDDPAPSDLQPVVPPAPAAPTEPPAV